MRFIDLIPLWSLFILTIVFVLIAIECGFRLSVYLHSRGKSVNETASAAMVSSTLALVAFMVAFTFGVAAQRFNDRRILIVDEANSIETTFLRAEFLPEVNKKEVQSLLRQYLDLRLRVKTDPEIREQILVESNKLQGRLWHQAATVSQIDPESTMVELFINSLNETIDLQSKRVAAALYARIPEHLWVSLYAMILLGMTASGYQAGKTGTRSWTASVILTVSFAIVMTIIADLDNPSEGFLKASREPLIDLQQRIGPPTTNVQATSTK